MDNNEREALKAQYMAIQENGLINQYAMVILSATTEEMARQIATEIMGMVKEARAGGLADGAELAKEALAEVMAAAEKSQHTGAVH